MSEVVIYSDGSSRGNPGNGGYGTVVLFTDSKGVVHEKQISEGYKMTTNNRMELRGVIAGLKILTRSCKVEVITDSKYVVDAFNQNWISGWQKNNWRNSKKETVKNKDLWVELIELTKRHEVRFTWVKGHNGNNYNEICDTLATNAADGNSLIDDEGFEVLI